MQTTLTKKLLYFIIPLLTIPIILLTLFSYKYLAYVVENEIEELTISEIDHMQQIIEKSYTDNLNFHDYLDKDEDTTNIVIIDKNINIISAKSKEIIGQDAKSILKKEIEKMVNNKDTSLYNNNQLSIMLKPLVNKNNEIVSFILANYEDSIKQRISLLKQTFLFILVIIIFITFIIIIVTIVFAFNITNPILELIRGTKIISDGDLSYHIPTTSNDEIGVLVNSFNEMVERLKLTQEKLKDESTAKSSFLANMSHEIRTPINAIIGFINILTKKETCEEKCLKLKIIKDSSYVLLDIINDILDFSKIESGKVEIEKHLFKTTSPFILTTELLQEKAQKKNITLNISYDKKLPMNAYSDTTRIKQIYMNLLSNAIKFSSENSNIDIDVMLDEQTNGLACSVKDTGIGIKPENIKKVFSAFEQEDSSITRSFGGTGLGLSISNTLAELMGGTLEVESEFGKGSTFTFTVDVFSNVPDIEIEEELNVENSSEIVFKGKVLIVEDNKTNQLLLKILLEEHGLEVAVANDGEEGVRACENEQFSLIMMDENMPNMNGLEAAKQIKQLESKKQYTTPIVAVTANALKEDRKRFLDAGMDDYISKPIDEAKLLKILYKFLGERKVYKGLYFEI